MIAINKTKQIPESLTNEKFQKHYKKFLNNEVKVSSDYYGAYDVRKTLSNNFYNKCAYCETKEFNPEIEHYRPKSKYKYLSYEWTNLLPVCHNCNHSKLAKFPVENTKIQKDINEGVDIKINDLQKLNDVEKPFVINPEIDNPKKHFDFNILGRIFGRTERGKATIDICNLNDKTLVYRRKKAYDDLYSYVKLSKYCKNSISKDVLDIVKNKINQNKKKDREYSLFWENISKKIQL